jgi:hypothetical protein
VFVLQSAGSQLQQIKTYHKSHDLARDRNPYFFGQRKFIVGTAAGAYNLCEAAQQMLHLFANLASEDAALGMRFELRSLWNGEHGAPTPVNVLRTVGPLLTLDGLNKHLHETAVREQLAVYPQARLAFIPVSRAVAQIKELLQLLLSKCPECVKPRQAHIKLTGTTVSLCMELASACGYAGSRWLKELVYRRRTYGGRFTSELAAAHARVRGEAIAPISEADAETTMTADTAERSSADERLGEDIPGNQSNLPDSDAILEVIDADDVHQVPSRPAGAVWHAQSTSLSSNSTAGLAVHTLRAITSSWAPSKDYRSCFKPSVLKEASEHVDIAVERLPPWPKADAVLEKRASSRGGTSKRASAHLTDLFGVLSVAVTPNALYQDFCKNALIIASSFKPAGTSNQGQSLLACRHRSKGSKLVDGVYCTAELFARWMIVSGAMLPNATHEDRQWTSLIQNKKNLTQYTVATMDGSDTVYDPDAVSFNLFKLTPSQAARIAEMRASVVVVQSAMSYAKRGSAVKAHQDLHGIVYSQYQFRRKGSMKQVYGQGGIATLEEALIRLEVDCVSKGVRFQDVVQLHSDSKPARQSKYVRAP